MIDNDEREEAETTARVPPHSVETEQAVLSAWLIHDRFGKAWTPQPELFYVGTHRAIATAMSKLDPACRDEASVFAQLEADGSMTKAGGKGRVHQVITGAPAYGDPWPHVAKLRELAALRAMMTTVTAAVAEAYVNKNLGATVTSLQEAMRAGASDTQAKTFSVQDMLRACAIDMQAKRDPRSCSTGLPTLDRHSGGFQHQQVTVFGAATSWGKTSYCVYLADVTLAQKKRPLIVSFEDPESLYGRRLMSRRARVNPNVLRSNGYEPNDAEWGRVLGEAERAEKFPFFINAIGKTVERVAADVRCVCASEGIDMVIVDYLQAIQCSKRQQDRRNEVTYIARVMTDVIKSSGCAGLMFSQFKRPMKPGEKPTKHSLKESGDLENAAEMVLLGFLDSEERRIIRSEKVKDGMAGKEYVIGWDPTFCGISGEVAEVDDPEPLADGDWRQ